MVDLRGKVNEIEMRLNEREGKAEKEHKEGDGSDQKHNEASGASGGGSGAGEEPVEGDDVVQPPKKKKKPSVPRHRPVGPQSVTLKDRYGNTHTFVRLERKVYLTAEQFQARVDSVEEQLLEKDVALSVTNMRAMGIGQRSLCLRQTSTVDECDPTDYEKEK